MRFRLDPLTAWNNIKDELLKLLLVHRTQRLAQERWATLSQRYTRLERLYNQLGSTMDLREPFPLQGDILLSKAFEDLVWNTPLDEEMDDEFLYKELAEHVSDILPAWRSSKELELLEILQKDIPTSTISDLHLATTVFRCHRCISGLQYPQMFYHQCCLQHFPDNRNPELKTLYTSSLRVPSGLWESTLLSFNKCFSNIARTAVKACHLDPEQATMQDLLVADPLTECLRCNDPGTAEWSGRLFMRWPLPVSVSQFLCSSLLMTFHLPVLSWIT